MNDTKKIEVSRRVFMKSTTAASAAALMASGNFAHAAGADRFRVAMVGCGSRGTMVLGECLKSLPGVELIALADMFQDKVDACLQRLRGSDQEKGIVGKDAVKVTPATTFLGFDAYKKVLAMKEVDLVLFATPPGFRPIHVRAAVEAGKHMFMEKPGAVDPVGIRSLLASSELAKKKGIAIGAGFQQRWMPQYQEILKHTQTGRMGQITGAQAYWTCSMVDWHWEPRKPEWSDMEWQIRCWPMFTWLSGDHVVEQLVHNLDCMNWVMGSTPALCFATGGALCGRMETSSIISRWNMNTRTVSALRR